MPTPWDIIRQDLDPQWVEFLYVIGGQLERTKHCFVAWIGDRHTLLVAHDDDLDADDSLSQIILHELCHHLIEGEASWHQDDWGLNNQSDDDIHREHAALRLQHHILHTPLCRQYLQPTTDHRWYFEALPSDSLRAHLCSETDAQSAQAASIGNQNWMRWPHRPALQALLAATETRVASFLRSR